MNCIIGDKNLPTTSSRLGGFTLQAVYRNEWRMLIQSLPDIIWLFFLTSSRGSRWACFRARLQVIQYSLKSNGFPNFPLMSDLELFLSFTGLVKKQTPLFREANYHSDSYCWIWLA